jgi:cyclic pyranopterin phosphate synthase
MKSTHPKDVRDAYQRPLRDLRISVTDRCNFRCGYCMPADRIYRFKPRHALLTFEEITQLATVFCGLGVRKLRITGGEPLLRRDLPTLIEMLSALTGIEDIALTTNGALLDKLAQPLADAGLQRVTVSLDSLQPQRFHEMSGGRGSLDQTLAGLAAAQAAGLAIKINAVVQRGVNDDEIPALASYAQSHGYTLRFIEFMDVGNINAWQATHVITAEEILDRLHPHFAFKPLDQEVAGETALRFGYDNGGQFGIIASVTKPFCGSCNRARLSAEGELFTCLFATKGFDLKQILREADGIEGVRKMLINLWQRRSDRYSEIREEQRQKRPKEKVEMFHIGG